jgi:hypothetical protein
LLSRVCTVKFKSEGKGRMKGGGLLVKEMNRRFGA